MLKLEQGIFSQPLLPGSTAGNIKLKNATLPGLPSECAVSVGGLDHYIAAIGAGIGTVADISESTGTVLACINVTNSFLPKPGACCGPCISEGKFYNLAFSSNGASVLEWYQQNYASQFSIPELIQECQKLTDTEGLAAQECANAYPGLTGFTNSRPEHTAAHFARAILESNSNTLAWLLKQLGAEKKSAVVATGGGAKSDFWLQLKANTLGRKMIRTNSQEPACRGAAMLAARSLFPTKPFERLSSEWIGIEREFNFAV
jgi:xylulokinase